MLRSSVALLLALVTTSVACGGSDDAVCDADALTAALASAGPGARVTVGACTVRGHFDVPAGVTVAGAGAASRLAPTGPEPVLAAATEAGAAATVLSDLALESNGSAAIIARGGGELVIERVTVQATLGLGVAAERLASFRATQLELVGPVDMNNASQIPFAVTATQSAIWGLVLVGIPAVQLTDTTIRGFAASGAVFVDSAVTWSRGSASDNLGLGVAVDGGSLNATGVEICRTLQPLTLALTAGGVFFSNASVETQDLEVCEGQGYGLVHLTGSARHLGLLAERNGSAAVWAQETSSLEVTGQLTDNDFAGVVAIDVATAMIHDAAVTGTMEVVRFFDTFGPKRIGDGIHLVGAMQNATLRDLTIAENERAGIVIELGGGAVTNVTLERVDATVTSTTQAAVVAQNGTTPAGWDSGVTRHGTTAANDAAIAGRLDTVAAVGPCDRPRETGLRANGVASIIGY